MLDKVLDVLVKAIRLNNDCEVRRGTSNSSQEKLACYEMFRRKLVFDVTFDVMRMYFIR